jgi:hypothetical protein
MNYLQVINEASISIAYGLCGLFYWDLGLDTDIHVTCILSILGLCYIMHLSLIGAKIIKFVIAKIRQFRRGTSSVLSTFRRID